MKISLLLRERWSGRQGKEYLSSLSHYIKNTMCINFHPYTHLFQRMVHFIVILQFRPALSGGTVSGLFLNLGLEIGNEHPVETVGCQGGLIHHCVSNRLMAFFRVTQILMYTQHTIISASNARVKETMNTV